MIEHLAVVSTNIESVDFDPETNMLTIFFKNGSVYEYGNVPETVFNELKMAPSVGKFVNSQIKPNYAFQRKF